MSSTHKILSYDSIPQRTGKPLPDDIDVMCRLVLNNIDGTNTLAVVGTACGLDEEFVLKVVDDLMSRDILFLPNLISSSGSDSHTGQPRHSILDAQAGVSEETRQHFIDEISSFHQSVQKLNHYELLDVDPDADRKVLRRSYFALSKRFHPDRAVVKDDPDLRHKMEVIFRHCTQAFDTLASPKLRAEYDESIADQLEIMRIERKLMTSLIPDPPPAAAAAEAQPETKQPLKPVKPKRPAAPTVTAGRPALTPEVTPSPPAKPAAPRAEKVAPKTEEEHRLSIGAAIRSSLGQSSTPPGAAAPTPETPAAKPKPKPRPRVSPRPEHTKMRDRWARDRAGKALTQVLKRGSAKPKPRVQARSRLEDAAIAFEQREFAEAERILEHVLKIDPDNSRAQKMLEEAREGITRDLSSAEQREGRLAEQRGDVEAAMEHYKTAVRKDPKNIEARHLLSQLLVQQRTDLTYAQQLAKEVISLGGQRGRYFANLGEIWLLAKDSSRAAEAFQRALTLEPDNKEYKKRLKACQ